jgi:hypothetical protein
MAGSGSEAAWHVELRQQVAAEVAALQLDPATRTPERGFPLRRSLICTIALILCLSFIVVWNGFPRHATLANARPPRACVHFQLTPALDGAADPMVAQRGYVALLYSGSVRSFPLSFPLQMLNLITPSPFEVHAFMAVNSMLTADQLPEGYSVANAFAFARSLRNNLSETWPPPEHPLVHADDGLRQLLTTLRYYTHFTDIDGVRRETFNLIKAFSLTYVELEPLPHTELFQSVRSRASNKVSAWHAVWSEATVAHLKMEYEQQHMTLQHHTYQWTFRQRFDVGHSLSVWDSIFKVQPLIQIVHQHLLSSPSPPRFDLSSRIAPGVLNSCNRLPDGKSFLLHDVLYRPRLLNSQHRVYVGTEMRWYFHVDENEFEQGQGTNDQMLYGNDEAMMLYSLRAEDWLTQPPAVLHPETNAMDALEAHHIAHIELPTCYMLIRASSCTVNEVLPHGVLTEQQCSPLCRPGSSVVGASDVQPHTLWRTVSPQQRSSAVNAQRSWEKELADQFRLARESLHNPDGEAAELLKVDNGKRREALAALDDRLLATYLEALSRTLKAAELPSLESAADESSLPAPIPSTSLDLTSTSSSYWLYFRFRYPELHDRPCFYDPNFVQSSKLDFYGPASWPFMERSGEPQRLQDHVREMGECYKHV